MSPVTRLPRRRWARLRRLLGYGAATLVIVAGLCVATLDQLLPLLARNPQTVTRWLSERVGQPVTVSGLDARWERSGPRFDLRGLAIGTGDERLLIDRATLQVDAYGGWLPSTPLAALQLDGLELTLEHDRDGRWQLHGVSRSETPFDLRRLEGFGELLIDRASLRVEDADSGQRWQLPRVDARLRSQSGRLQFAAVAHAERGAPLRLQGDIDTATGGGIVHLDADGIDLQPWLQSLTWRGLSLVDGSTSSRLWLHLREAAVTEARFEISRTRLTLSHPDSRGLSLVEPPTLAGRFLRTAHGWQLAVDADSGGWLRLDADATARHLQAGDLQLEQLVGWLPPVSDAAITLGEKLRAAGTRGRLELLRADWQDDDVDHLVARLTDVSVEPVGERPGFAGLSLDVAWADQVARIDVGSPSFTLNWPIALREPLVAALGGQALLQQIDGAWQLDAEQIAARGRDFGFDVAGNLRFDGGRPSADLRVDVFEAPIVAAKGFWLRHRMPANAVRWLDEALLDGRLQHGRLMLRGDLDRWPFAGNEGRMIAHAEVDDVALRFHPQWPIATALAGTATFINRSIAVDISAQVLGNRVERAVGEIASLRDPRLVLDIRGNGSGPALLDLMRRSPLQEKYRDSLQSLSIGGDAQVQLQLDIPFAKRLGEFAMRGQAQLSESDLRDARWGIALDAAEGDLAFTERGLLAQGLRVLYSGQPARFSIALGNDVAEAGHIVEASLRGRLGADTLLDVQPGLGWLKPYMAGTSDWQIGVTVPLAPGIPLLQIDSDLVGTTISLPAPLSKVAAVRMPLHAEVGLGSEDSGDPSSLDLTLGSLLHLYGQLREEATFNGVAAFGEVAPASAPPRGLRVIGQMPVLDASAWAAMADASSSGESMIVDVDVHAGEFGMLDRRFAETTLRLQRPEPGAMQLTFEGPALDGVIDIPPPDKLDERGITARMQRLHWPAASGASAITDLIDPSTVPAFHLWVKQFQMGDADLGEMRLETFPQPTGMRVDLFESRSPALQLFGRGDWTRIESRSRSNFELEFTAPELGGMLQALGFSELIEGGQTFAKLRASWPGPPAAFEMEQVEGALEINVGQGSVPQVKPGAGRLLGLFSLSEIPRRLSLDFSDFFRSGLAFNTISGSFVIADGDAVTDDLVIDSPAAEIRIRGRTGLKAQDYTQTMEVLPRTGSVLPMVGALAGGPAGAAIGAVAQAVLVQPFKQINRTLYRVEGPWSKPEVEVLERGPARSEGAEPGP